MYTTRFDLRKIPFNISPDHRFCYASPLHEDVYYGLLTHIRDRAGLILLTSEPGAGKTLLLHRVMSEVNGPISFPLFPNMIPTFDELLLSICNDLGFEPKQGSTSHYLHLLCQFLIEETVHALQRLLDLTQNGTPLLQIVLSGQLALGTTLQQPSADDIALRIAVQYRLLALLAQEVGPFIQYRLNIAGG